MSRTMFFLISCVIGAVVLTLLLKAFEFSNEAVLFGIIVNAITNGYMIISKLEKG
jgi:uncharacterized membrane protein YeaQ/YmgE (transglycosylase-associated protein family)